MYKFYNYVKLFYNSINQLPSGLLTGHVCSSRPDNIQGKKSYYRVLVRYITDYSYFTCCKISDGICVSQLMLQLRSMPIQTLLKWSKEQQWFWCVEWLEYLMEVN